MLKLQGLLISYTQTGLCLKISSVLDNCKSQRHNFTFTPIFIFHFSQHTESYVRGIQYTLSLKLITSSGGFFSLYHYLVPTWVVNLIFSCDGPKAGWLQLYMSGVLDPHRPRHNWSACRHIKASQGIHPNHLHGTKFQLPQFYTILIIFCCKEEN